MLKANKNNDGLVIDKSAFFNGIPIYYVNDSDELVEEKVSPLKYIQMQRQFAMECLESQSTMKQSAKCKHLSTNMTL